MGDRIEDYQVLDLLGKGGFANVYRARCKHNGQEVAIKMIDKKLMRAAGMVARVQNEVEIHCQLKHPSILELYKFFEDQKYVYLVLEMCHNGELQQYLNSHSRVLSEREAAVYLTQIIDGLEYLHSHGIVHRDLTLSNLLLTRDMSVKIADFGLATKLQMPDEKHLTMCGTPNFISPEIVARQPHGLGTDVWSLGCMLYTFFTGHPPFDTEGVKSTLNKVASGTFIMPKNLSQDAQNLIAAMLQKDPKQRISLSAVRNHPFMMTSSHKQGEHDTSVDSGHVTVTTTTVSQSVASAVPKGQPVVFLPSTSTVSSKTSTSHRTLSEYRQFPRQKMRRSSSLGAVSDTRIQMSASGGLLQYPQQTSLRKRSASLQSMDTRRTLSDQCSVTREHHQKASRELGRKLCDVCPPLSAKRLRPIKQKTRNSIVSISDNGDVCVEFMKTRQDAKVLCEVFQVSCDGQQVFVSQKPGDGLKRYSYDDLPERYHKKYLYASQFVYLVQSKTPKVTFYSPQAKCMLMENVPNPDCEVCFYNGPKVHFTEQHVKLIDACGGLHTMTSPSLSGLSDDSQRLLSHAQECKAKCKAIQSTMEELSRTAGCYENFPVIVGRRPTPIASKPSPSQDDVTASGTSTKLTNSGNAVSPSTVAVNTASVKSYDTMMSEQLIRRVFVPNVGWASQMNNHNIHIDYNDGSQLQINSDVTRVTYLTAEGQKTK
jgi:polo-like kinase 4